VSSSLGVITAHDPGFAIPQLLHASPHLLSRLVKFDTYRKFYFSGLQYSLVNVRLNSIIGYGKPIGAHLHYEFFESQ